MTDQERAERFALECDRMKLAGILAIKGNDPGTARQAAVAARRALMLIPGSSVSRRAEGLRARR